MTNQQINKRIKDLEPKTYDELTEDDKEFLDKYCIDTVGNKLAAKIKKANPNIPKEFWD